MKRNQIRTSSGYPVSGALVRLDQGKASLLISKAREIIAHACRISSQKISSYTEACSIHGITQLGLWSHPTLKASTMTFSLIRPDKRVYLHHRVVRPFSPCHPTQAVGGSIVCYVRNPYPTFPCRVHDFYGHLYPGLGRSHGVFPDCGCLDPFKMQVPHQCAGDQDDNIGPPTLGGSIIYRAIMF